MKEKSFKKSGDKERKKGEKRKVWKMGKIREDSGSEKKTVKEKVKEKVRYIERKGGGKQREVNLVNNEKEKN